MDKLVRRVTVVQGGDSKIVYESEDDPLDSEGKPNFENLEKTVRHVLKAQLVAAQEAYDRHLESAKKEGNAWMEDAPGTLMKAGKKAMKELRAGMPKEMRKRMPFGSDNDDEEK